MLAPAKRWRLARISATASGAFTEPLDNRPTLASAGIDKKLSTRAQKLAAVLERQENAANLEFRHAAQVPDWLS